MKLKKQKAVSDNTVEWIIAGLALVAIIIFDREGMPQKWHAATMWTGVAFGPSTLWLRKRWRSWSFWLCWTIYLILHVLLMWILFEYLLARVKILGMLYVVPFAAVEAFVLLVLLSKRKVPRPVAHP